MMRITMAAVLLFGLSNSSTAQSFDCKKAQTRIEKMICADAGLRELDEHLGRYYSAGRMELEGAASCLQTDQTQWLKSTRDGCQDAVCLKTAYLNRLGELDALQPGATAIKNIELPRVPTLAWVIGPALDKVAAPSNAKAQPFEVTGALVNDVENGDGFVLRRNDGTKVPLVLLMFLEGKTQQQLVLLAKEKGVFLHRMPATAPRSPFDSDDQDQEKQMEKIQKTVLTQGKVCADPNHPCEGFKANELSFAIAKPFKFDRGRDKSQPFYAVILKSGPLCGINDSERIDAQKKFPGAKVFLHRHMCEDFNDKVTYSNVNAKSGFVAVYAGETEADARKVLAQAIAAGYKDANFRRMEVIVVYQLE